MSSKTFMYVRSAPSPTPGSFVSTAGNNANAGTFAAPWRTIKYGVAQGVPLLQIRGGSYPEALNNNSGDTIPSGTSGHPLIVQAYNGEQVAMTPVDGSITAVLALYGVTFTYWKGIIFDATGLSNTSAGDALGISGANDNTFELCDFKEAYVNGIQGYGNRNLWLNCNSFNNGTDLLGKHGYGIYLNGGNTLANASINNVVDGGNWHNNMGGGLTLYNEGLGGMDGNVFRSLRAYRNGFRGAITNSNLNAKGILTGDSIVAIIRNCLVYDNQGPGIEVYTGTAAKLYSNSTYSNGIGNGWNNILLDAGATAAIVENNIAFFGGASPQILDQGSGTTLSHNVETNPSFADAPAGDFHIPNSGPAYQSGLDLSSIFTKDFYGTTRTVPWDCGAIKAS